MGTVLTRAKATRVARICQKRPFEAQGKQCCAPQKATEAESGPIFTVLGAVSEGERNLIAERVRAGLRNARAKGKKLGRPKVEVDVAQIESLRASGLSWRSIVSRLGLSVGTVHAAARDQQKTQSQNRLCA